MRYSIGHETENGLPLVVLRDLSGGTEAKILPSMGGLLHAFSIPVNGSLFNVIDNYANLNQAQNEISRSYKSAKLSPFPCRIADARYQFQGKVYQFKSRFSDGSAIHGLLYNKPFAVKNQSVDEHAATLELAYEYNQDDDQFPFKYLCEVHYRLSANSELQVLTRITNRSPVAIPMADGWHPYFQLGGMVDGWLLSFDSEWMVEFDDKLIPTGKLIGYEMFQHPRAIGTDFFDNCFVLDVDSSAPACELLNPANKLSIKFFCEANYPYLQVYTPAHRKSIAIENLSSAPDAFNNGMGLILLGPQDAQTFSLRYQLSLG
jgi:aldose 1-epimerase